MTTLPTFYNEKYYIDFDSAPDDNGAVTDYRVTLYKREGKADLTPNPIRLEGGPSAFVLSLGNDDDPLTTTRVASAQISFFDDISLSDLLPTDATEWRVELMRLNDNKRIFVGYLTAEIYTQPDIEGPNVVTVNAASPVVAILAEDMPLGDRGIITIGELLHLALTEVKGIEEVFIPAMYSLTASPTASQFTDILRLSMATGLYIKQNDLAQVTGREYDYATFAEPIEALCRLFGWSLVDVGDGALYFIAPAYEGDYMRLSLDDLTKDSPFTPTLVRPTIFAEGALQPIDAGDTMEIRQGVGSATIKVEATDIKVATPNIEEGIQEQRFSRKTLTTAFPGGTGEVAVAKIVAKTNAPNVRLYRYELANGQWRQTDALISDSVLGVGLEKFDWVDPETIKISAEDRKRSWSLQTALYFREMVSKTAEGDTPPYSNAIISDSSPMLSMRLGSGLFPSGAFCINANVLAAHPAYKEGFYISKDYYYIGGNMEEAVYDVSCQFWSEYNKVIRCSLRVGDHWWSGARWTTEETTFYLSVSTAEAQWHPLVSNKNVDMLYEDGDGVYIPIPEPIAGEIEFTMYRTEVVNSSGVQSGYNGYYYVKDFSISYKPTIEYIIPSIEKTTYYRPFTSRFTESKEETLTIHSRINGSEQMSLLYQDGSTSIDTLYRTTHDEVAKPERFLLDEYQRLYSHALQRWKRGVTVLDVRPIDLFARTGVVDSLLMITGSTADFDENTLHLYLSKIKKYGQ